jgi:hypothetical protein
VATTNAIQIGSGELVGSPATTLSSVPTAAAPANIAAPDLAITAVLGGSGSVPKGAGMWSCIDRIGQDAVDGTSRNAQVVHMALRLSTTAP